MSSSIISSPLIIFLIPSILILFSTPTHSTNSSTLIKKICSTSRLDIDTKLCTRVLESQPTVVSATNMLHLSIAIIKSGISRSTHTRTYIENLLKKRSTDPESKGVLQECNSSYHNVVGSFNSALSEVNEHEYFTATYDLLIAGTDDIVICENAVASKKMKDEIILNGNKIVPVFASSAYDAVEALPQHDGK